MPPVQVHAGPECSSSSLMSSPRCGGWSWWLVLLPLWCPVVIALLFVVVFLMSAGTDRLSEWMVRWRIRRRHAGDNPELWL